MPKSKRSKQYDLSKTKKHGLEGKKHLYEEIRNCVENYANLFIFSVTDMRNSKMKRVRDQWKHSRFFIGKNKVMAMALGRTPEEEYRTNLHKMGQSLKGEKGLLFSNQSTEEVLSWFKSYSEGDFARSGNTATEDVSLKEGPLPQFPHNLESYLRQLGLPTTLKRGIVHLIQDHDVCKAGDVLSPDCARILKLLGYEMAEFQIKIECVWSQDGTFLDLKSDSKENIVGDGKKSAMKEGFQISEDLSTLDNDENMEVIENEDQIQNEKITSPCKAVDPQGNTTAEEETDMQEKDNNKEDHQEKSKQEEEKTNGLDSKEEQNIDEEEDSEDEAEESAEKETDEVKEDESEETLDSAAMLNLTQQKIEDVEKTPPKYSPKMTRARARASAVKKPLTPEERAARTRSARKSAKKT